MILQYAHHLSARAAAAGREVAVYAHIRVRLNDGNYQTYIDPTVDLTREAWNYWATQSWIVGPK
jgi:hypothetical protein